ncbi:hypothetical protein PPYR_01436 [Photinus pyralis]|uniref:MADF domain-containing protein n=2 Tax=Photinus pyralis TaxID=7054 RepID=A0A5N4B4H0_PHOPY|nr:hypothetical protein PPYR_01436 [Photinus pyralis]
MNKKVFWDKLAKSLREKGHINVDGASLDQKFRYMKNTFKKIKDNSKKTATGRSRVNWKYFDWFEQICASDKAINPPMLVSTIAIDDEAGTSNKENGDNVAKTPSSSRSSTPDSRSGTRLDTFRKRHLILEEARLEELKAIRLEIAESNKINREKLDLLKQHLTCHNNN